METINPTEFFAPSTTSPIEYLLQDYAKESTAIKRVSEFMLEEKNKATISYFRDSSSRGKYGADWDFSDTNALKTLDSKYWDKALRVTDVLDYMPSKRRDEWTDSISDLKAPAFDPETVHATLKQLLNQRMDFLAEMVDGIFTGLSGEHVTNRPEAFCSRMILANVCDSYSHYGTSKQGLIHDMRCVIAKFMGKKEKIPCFSTRTLIEQCSKETGRWFGVDGNAFRLRVYKKGTAHLEVNPDIAYRLNQILAYLHPMAIAAPHKRRPNSKPKKDFVLIERIIPFAVLDCLSRMSVSCYKVNTDRVLGVDKHVMKEAYNVLASIGGVKEGRSYVFKHDVTFIIAHIITSGVLPDKVSHQFYPTPDSLADTVVSIANIKASDTVLEPSAGQGSLLRAVNDAVPLFEVAQPLVLEISDLHCKILKETYEDYTVICRDFLEYKCDLKSKIIMNPPYSQGRAIAHVNHAVTLLKKGGVCVAILPSSVNGKLSISGCSIEFHGVYDNEFKGTSISVCIAKITKEGMP